MTIAIAALSMTLGFFLGYKVGFNRCMKQFIVALELLRKQMAKNSESLSKALKH